MFWAIGLIVALLFLGATLIPSQRERSISALSPANRKWHDHDESKEARVLPKAVSDRDIAYILEYYRRFGERQFSYNQVKGRRLSRNLMMTFEVKSGPLDDKTVMGSRLPELGLLSSSRPGRYQLTDLAIKLAKLQTQGAEAL